MTSSTKEKRVEHIQMLLNACAQLGPIRSIDIAAFIWRNEPSALRMAQSLIADMLKERVLLMRKHGHTPLYVLSAKGAALCKDNQKSGKDLFRGLRKHDRRHLANEFCIHSIQDHTPLTSLNINQHRHLFQVDGRLPDVMFNHGNENFDWIEVDSGHTSEQEQTRRCQFILKHFQPDQHLNVSPTSNDPMHLCKFHLIVEHEAQVSAFLTVFNKHFLEKCDAEQRSLTWRESMLHQVRIQYRVGHAAFQEDELYLHDAD